MLPIISNANKYANKIAIYASGNAYQYKQLLHESAKLSYKLLNNREDLAESRVAFMVSPGFNYVKTLWAIWQAGGIAVPLCITHPLPSLEYVLDDTNAEILVLSKEYIEVLRP
jgi:malonyl-CoA/methylmalonyl-CoA synthetase